jgi:hypothetical protein
MWKANGRTDDYPWQKLTWSMARWANKMRYELNNQPSFFLKLQNRFEPNLAEMFIGWSYTRFLFPISAKNKILVYDHPMNISAKFDSNLFCGFRKKRWKCEIPKGFNETAEQKSAKLARNVHWMVLYQDHPMNISAKFDSNLFCGFRKKDENVKFP